nr:FAD-dependent monooxygenase [Gordonia soli]
MRVAVVGAGVGGLALAGALRRSGAQVVVLERASEFAPVGSGLSLCGNGFRALDALSLGDRVRAVTADAPPPGTAGGRRPDGSWLIRFSSEATARIRVVDRTELHTALLDGLADVEIRTGAQVVAADDTGVTLADDERVGNFDVVVGADGLRSRVRAGWPADPGVTYAGYGAWRGITRRPIPLTAGGETFGSGKRFGIAPLRDGRVYWFAAISTDRDARPDHTVLREAFAGWHAPVGELIDATDADAVSYLPIEYLAQPLPSYRQGTRVLLGDAAHAMTPDLGQGANQALEDAAVLEKLLRPAIVAHDRQRISPALGEYDAIRRPRSQAVASQARLVGRVGQAAGVRAALRDAALRIAPDRVVSARSVRIQDWHP